MHLNIKTLLAAGVTALLLTTATIACNKDKNTEKTTTRKSVTRDASDDACTTCCSGGVDSAEVFGVPLASVGLYSSWTPIASNFCGTGPQVYFEGQFNSIIKAETGWTVGYLNGVSYSTDLSTLNCSSVTPNIVPTQGNYIGNENPTSCPTCPGYYNYSTGAFTRLVTVSKCCANGTIKVYVIKVTVLDAYSDDGYNTFNSKVVYEYKCFNCTLEGSCPVTPGSKTAKAAEVPHEVWKEIPAMFLKHGKK